MNNTTLRFSLTVLAAAVFPAAAGAAALPVKIPSLAAFALKPVPLPLLPSTPSLPSFPAPISAPLSLPGPSFPLPAPAPLELPAAEIHLDWSFLDGRDGAAVAAPKSPAPKPLPPAGAAVALRFAADAAKDKSATVRVGSDAFFDQARPRVLVEVP